jgi:transcriptional regulator with XRE-family HTH domain
MLDATKLSRKRIAKGWTQAELGIKTGISRGRIEDYEAGRLVSPTLYTLLRLCEALNCKVDDIIDYEIYKGKENRP